MAFQMQHRGAIRAASAAPRRARTAAPRVTTVAAAGTGSEAAPSQQPEPRRMPKLIDLSQDGSKGPVLSRRTLVVPPALATAAVARWWCPPRWPPRAWQRAPAVLRRPRLGATVRLLKGCERDGLQRVVASASETSCAQRPASAAAAQ